MSRTAPITVNKDSVVVKIYYAPARAKEKKGKKGKKYDAWIVRYYANGKAVQKRFSQLEGVNATKCARAYADEVIKKIKTGNAAALSLTAEDSVIYLRAKEAAKPLNLPIDIIVHKFAELVQILGDVPPIVAIKDYRRNHPDGFVFKTVREVYDELLISKKQDGYSAAWVRDLKYRLGSVCEKFGQLKIVELNGVQLDEWLRGRNMAPKTRNNFIGCLHTLFSFAKSRKYLPKDFSEMESVLPAKKNHHEKITIYTPAELEKLLKASQGALFRFIAIGAYAGLRSSEIARLEWPCVSETAIKVETSRKRGAKRRLAPLLEPLAVLLKDHRKPEGKVWPLKKEYPDDRVLENLKKDSGVEWDKNALRHSFISYRLALVKSTAQVALECGTSEQKIFENYRELVEEKEAEKWFQIYKSVTKEEKPAKKRIKKQ